MAKEVKGIVATEEGNKSQCGSCEPKEDSIIWGKIIVAKLTVLDKIISGMGNGEWGMGNGSNIEHCLTLSNIYKNLCN